MKAMSKQLLCIMLAALMCLSLFPFPALAASDMPHDISEAPVQAETDPAPPETQDEAETGTGETSSPEPEATPAPTEVPDDPGEEVIEPPTTPKVVEPDPTPVPSDGISEDPIVPESMEPEAPAAEEPVVPEVEETPVPTIDPMTIGQDVQPLRGGPVSAPLITVTVHYTEEVQVATPTNLVTSSISAHSYHPLAKISGDSMVIPANNFPNEISVSTEQLSVMVDGELDVTPQAEYDPASGNLCLPARYWGHEVQVSWYCSYSEMTTVSITATVNVNMGGAFVEEIHTLTLSSNADTIEIPISEGEQIVVAQAGIDLSSSAFRVENGGLTVYASPLGGDISVTAYAAAAPQMRLYSLRSSSSRPTTVTHTRSADQIWYGYYTSYYTANGNTAFCLDPTVSGLNAGTYNIDYWLENGSDMLVKCCYYLYGGPGYSYVQNVFQEPDALWAYGMCHAVASYAYMGSLDAFKGLGDELTGQLLQVYNYVASLPSAPSGFEAFVYNTGSSTNQPMIGWQYNPTSDPEPEPEPDPTGTLVIRKTSADGQMTSGNICYALAGAVFDVYDASGYLGATVTTDANGYADVTDMPVGSYYFVERTPPQGFAGTSQRYSFIIYEDDTTTVTVENIPQNDPSTIVARKQDADTSSAEAQGGAGLAGAQFTLKYYKGNYTSAAALAGVSPARTWVVETDEDGFAMLHPDYKISGDDFYYNSAGTIVTLPLGTLTIQETKAPTGYLLNNELFIRQITANGTVESVNTYNEPIVKESVIRGGVAIEKWDIEINKAATSQGDAVLSGAVLEIVNRSDNAVVVGGKSYAPGTVVHTLTTDESCAAATANNLLPYGTYEIKEKKPPTGYLNTGEISRTFEIRANGVTVSLTTENSVIKNDVIRGGLSIEKWDNELNRSGDPQGDASLAGAVFEIINRSQHSVVVDGAEYDPGEVVKTITTEEGGKVTTNNDPLPYGTYEVVEKTPPTGYLPTGVLKQTFSIREDGKIVELTSADTVIKNDVIRGGMEIHKWDIERNDTALKQGDAVLSGAVFDIFNTSKYSVLVDSVEYAPGEVVVTLTTDESGAASTAADALPYGSYEIVERTPPLGYLPTGITRQAIQIRENGKIVDLTSSESVIKNEIIRGNVLVEKWDHETGKYEAQGGATLMGAEMEIVNRSADSVLVDSILYAPGEVVFTGSTDETGTLTTPELLLPYGTYEVREIAPPEGYLAEGVLSRFFEIREHGKTVALNTAESAIRNVPIRGDLEGVKIADGTAERLAGVPFKITSKTTGESHVVIIDQNGQLSTASEWNPHSQNTNLGESDEDGVWFGEIDTLNDDVGALLYDTYILEELPCAANENMELLTFEVSVYRNGYTIHLGTLTDDYIPQPEIFTTALEKESMAQEAYATGKVTIVDTVYYSGLKPGTEYKLAGVLMDKESNAPLLVNGTEVRAEKTFRAAAESGSTTMEFNFDASALKGKAVVVFETLYLEDAEIAAHADIEDVEQTVTFKNPEIGTSAAGSNGEKVLDVTAEAVIVDTVTYTGLIPGKEYALKGSLMDKATGKPVMNGDKPVTAEGTFTPEQPNGAVTLTFTLDASSLAGKQVVAFERLFIGEAEIAAHADIEDKNQTISFIQPKIGTSAAGKDGKKEISLSSAATIVDTVKYENLAVGQEYTLKGVLMDKSTGKPVLVGDKEVTAQTTFIPEQPSGTVEVTFTFDASALSGKQVVIFERLFIGEAEIAAHADIEDKDQAVSFIQPKIGTSAADEKGKKVLLAAKDAKIIDTVKYENLTVGKEYTLKGVLMNRVTGKALLVNNKEITAEVKFKPDKASGKVEVPFVLDASALAGTQVVVFETLYLDGKEIAAHKDIKDEGQTVGFAELVLKLTKINSATKDNLDGAEFTLYDAAGKEIKLSKGKDGVYYPDEKGSAVITTEKGVALISGLGGGELTLKETKAPEGFVGYTEPIKFTMTLKDTSIDDPFPVTVYNAPEGSKTGSGAKTGRDGLPMWALYTGIGLFAAAAAVGVLYLRKRKMN